MKVISAVFSPQSSLLAIALNPLVIHSLIPKVKEYLVDTHISIYVHEDMRDGFQCRIGIFDSVHDFFLSVSDLEIGENGNVCCIDNCCVLPIYLDESVDELGERGIWHGIIRSALAGIASRCADIGDDYLNKSLLGSFCIFGLGYLVGN